MARQIYNIEDIIDVRDVIARVEELQEDLNDIEELRAEGDGELSEEVSEEQEELNSLKELLSDLADQGGDEEWEGDWYPITLIRATYFTQYAQELVQDIGDLPSNIPSYLVIDWEATAKNLLSDYSSVDFEGVTYLYR